MSKQNNSVVLETQDKDVTTRFAERFLWQQLRGPRLEGYAFQRQQPIGEYVAAIVNFDKRMVIEICEKQGKHKSSESKEQKRIQYFKQQGFDVLQFHSQDVTGDISGVLREIKKAI